MNKILKKMMNVEQYENLIILLENALAFYANESNYSGGTGTIPPIDADENGSQARFALAKIKEFRDIMKNAEKDYNKMIDNVLNSTDSPENIMNIINKIKQIGNAD